MAVCHSCEENPIRKAGRPVSWLEGITGDLLYCAECAAEYKRGEWETDPDA